MFVIKSIVGKDVTVEATLESGKVTQTINNVPVHDEAATRLFLTDYFKAYEEGKRIEKQKADALEPSEGLIGKKLEALTQEDANSVSLV